MARALTEPDPPHADPPHADLAHADLAHADAATVRAAIRAGRYARHTAGLAAGVLQCNLAILPAALALDFMRFCQRNPRPCPLVAVSDTGDAMLRTLGRDIDAAATRRATTSIATARWRRRRTTSRICGATIW